MTGLSPDLNDIASFFEFAETGKNDGFGDLLNDIFDLFKINL